MLAKSTYTAPAGYYVALTKTLPTAADTGSTISETTYTNYARLLTHTADYTAITGQASSNVNPLSFAAPGTTGDTVNGWALCDAATGGNMLYYGPLAAVVIAASGTAPSIGAGGLTLAES